MNTLTRTDFRSFYWFTWEDLGSLVSQIISEQFNITNIDKHTPIKEVMYDYIELESKVRKTKEGPIYDQRIFDRWLALFPEIKFIQDISLIHGEKYQIERKNKGIQHSTINREMNSMRALASFAERHDLIIKHPFKRLKNLSVPKTIKPFLEPEQAIKLLDTARRLGPEHIYLFISICLFGGLRRGEALNLKWGDIDWKRRLINIKSSNEHRTKSNKSRVISCEESLLEILSSFYKPEFKPEDYIITYKGDNVQSIRKAFNSVFKAAGLPQKAQTRILRTSCATLLAGANVPIKSIQQILGHSSVETTSAIYTQLSSSLQQQHQNAISKLMQGKGKTKDVLEH